VFARSNPGADSVERQPVEVKVEVQRAAEALREDHGAREAALRDKPRPPAREGDQLVLAARPAAHAREAVGENPAGQGAPERAGDEAGQDGAVQPSVRARKGKRAA
jgi:hypothetical protein